MNHLSDQDMIVVHNYEMFVQAACLIWPDYYKHETGKHWTDIQKIILKNSVWDHKTYKWHYNELIIAVAHILNQE